MEENRREKNQIGISKKTRTILVAIFVFLFIIISYIFLRGSYLEYKELGEVYLKEFIINCQIKYIAMATIFIFLYIVIYLTNRGIKKGLKEFFDVEKKQMPKLLNKSLALVISAIVSMIASNSLTQKI